MGHTDNTRPNAVLPMTADLRSILVRLLDAWDETEPGSPALMGVVEELRAEVHADKELRDELRRAFEQAATASDRGKRFTFPAEPLAREYGGLTHREHLMFAWQLFCAKNAGSLTTGNMTDVRAWCWAEARRFLADFDKPPPAAPKTVADPPLRERDRTYLLWLVCTDDLNRFLLTDAGRAEVERLKAGRPEMAEHCGGLVLGEQEEAA